jgi:multisubunit Na+/H+ antiporter MnhB subunit
MATDGAGVARTEPRPLPTRWLNTYTGTLGLLGVSLVVAPLLLRPGGSAANLVMVGLGAFLIAVSVGLAKRERWAWQVNYWGLVAALVGLGLTILSGLPLLRTPQELVTPLFLGLAVGLWCGLNLRYFRRRRSLFS